MRSEVLLQQTTKWHLTLRFCGNLQCSRDPQPSCQKPTPLNPTNPATFPRNIIRTFLMLCTCLRTSGLLYGLESNAVAISNRSCLCRGFAEVGLWGELGRFLLPHFFSAVFPSSVPNINSPQWKLVFFFACMHPILPPFLFVWCQPPTASLSTGGVPPVPVRSLTGQADLFMNMARARWMERRSST